MEYQFEKLNAWQESRKMVVAVYQLLKKFPSEERYALCDQLRRAAVSITSNIAEGSGRSSAKEKVHFLEISYSSLMEVLSQMDIALDLEYITEEDFCDFEIMCDKVACLISGLRTYFTRSDSNL